MLPKETEENAESLEDYFFKFSESFSKIFGKIKRHGGKGSVKSSKYRGNRMKETNFMPKRVIRIKRYNNISLKKLKRNRLK